MWFVKCYSNTGGYSSQVLFPSMEDEMSYPLWGLTKTLFQYHDPTTVELLGPELVNRIFQGPAAAPGCPECAGPQDSGLFV